MEHLNGGVTMRIKPCKIVSIVEGDLMLRCSRTSNSQQDVEVVPWSELFSQSCCVCLA